MAGVAMWEGRGATFTWACGVRGGYILVGQFRRIRAILDTFH